MISRRNLFARAAAGAALGAAGAVNASGVSRVAMAALPEPAQRGNADTMPPAGRRRAAGPTTRWSRSTAGPCPGA